MDFQQCNVMMRDDIRFSAVKLEVCPDSKSESYVQWLPVLLIRIVIFYLHKMYYVHMYTHNMRRLQQILHRPDTQCHGCALHGIQW